MPDYRVSFVWLQGSQCWAFYSAAPLIVSCYHWRTADNLPLTPEALCCTHGQSQMWVMRSFGIIFSSGLMSMLFITILWQSEGTSRQTLVALCFYALEFEGSMHDVPRILNMLSIQVPFAIALNPRPFGDSQFITRCNKIRRQMHWYPGLLPVCDSWA